MPKSARYPASISTFISQADREWIDLVAERTESSVSEVMRAAIKLGRSNGEKVEKLLER